MSPADAQEAAIASLDRVDLEFGPGVLGVYAGLLAKIERVTKERDNLAAYALAGLPPGYGSHDRVSYVMSLATGLKLPSGFMDLAAISEHDRQADSVEPMNHREGE